MTNIQVREFYLFQYIIFMVQYIISPSQWTQVCIRTIEKKQTKNERWKENHWRKTNYFIGKYATSYVRFYNVGFKIFKNFKILKYFIMWDVQPQYYVAIKKWSGKWVFVTGVKFLRFMKKEKQNTTTILLHKLLWMGLKNN